MKDELSNNAKEIVRRGLKAIREGKSLDDEITYASGEITSRQSDISSGYLAKEALKEIAREYILDKAKSDELSVGSKS